MLAGLNFVVSICKDLLRFYELSIAQLDNNIAGTAHL